MFHRGGRGVVGGAEQDFVYGTLADRGVYVFNASTNTFTSQTFKYVSILELGSAVNPASTTLASAGIVASLPRAGTYVVDGLIDCSVSTNPTTVAWGFNVSANLTRCTFGFDHNLTASTYVCATQNGSLAVGGTGVASGSHTTITTGFPTFVSGTVVVTGLANLMIMVSRSAATLSINPGSYLRVQEL